MIFGLDFSAYQIFSKDQLKSSTRDSNEVFTDHCFINCMKLNIIDEDTIEFARDNIKDVLPLWYLDKICRN
jgi:hypothetical protein